jgi:hypothetical protein
MQTATEQQSFCGREFTTEDVSLIQEVVETFAGLSRFELAHTVCELLEWKRPGGGLKARECRDFLERLERVGESGGFDASGQKVVWIEQTQKTHFAR